MPARVAVAGAVVVGAGLFLCGSRSPKERIISVRPDGDTEPAVTGVLADDDVALDKVPLVADALRFVRCFCPLPCSWFLKIWLLFDAFSSPALLFLIICVRVLSYL